MRPNFALSLSFSGIQLLQRQAAGWGRVGDVDISSADLTSELAALRDKALALGSGPVQTKLIIPNDQIKYLTVDAVGLDKDALQAAVLKALDGATPYPVDDLEFDFANENGSVHIAAVAKETLQEAESFATEHGFEPMGFVAAPTQGNFPKEPTFGLSALARSKGIMALEADVQPAIATGEAVAVVKEPDPVEEIPEELNIPVAGFSSRCRTPETEPVLPIPVREPSVATTDPTPAEASPQLGGAERGVDLTPAPKAPAPTRATAAPTGPTPQITGVSDAALDETALDSKLGGLRPGAAFDDSAFDDDIPPMPASFAAAPRGGAAMHGAADGSPIADLRAPSTPPVEPLEKAPNALKENGAKAAAKAFALAGTAGGAALAGARGLMAKRAKKAETKAAPVPEPQVVAAEASVEDEKQRMTVFGARKPKKKKEPIAIGGKPRFLGLILTAILLLFLVSVAAWASVFLDDGLARFFGGSDRDKAIAELPNPDASVEPSAEELIELASLDTGENDILADDLPLAQDGLTQVAPEPAPAVISPEEAEATYAATGIWLATPEMPLLPPKISLEDVYTASIDARITGQDAFAMEPLSQPRDVLPAIAAAPAPANSDFAFDQNGLVVATPDGAATPEGALVFLGRPARVPPAIPERLRNAALAPDTTEEPEALDNGTVASLRPKTRPETLVEDTERTQLGGVSRAELAKIRPKLRPRVEKEVEEAEAAQTPATRLAVAASRKPAPRPRNFARVVALAQKQAERQSAQEEPQATQVAAVAPRTVKPSIPSSASVAKNATVRNAINLSRVNLIGVYGKPSSRRALVRLSSGRYKKVKVGDRVDGGRVSAIGEGQLIYTKRGRNVTLRMPKG